MTPQNQYNALLAQKVIKEFKARNIEGFFCETKEETLIKILEIIPENSVVSWGGSSTLNEIGVLDALRSGPYTVLDPSAVQGGAEMNRIAHQAMNADYYLLSANAVSASGEFVNIDGIGNRVAALSYGPKNVVVIAGLNKVEQNLESAILRAKTRAAPLTLLKYGKANASSFEELLNKAENIGSQLVITTRSAFKDRIKVILVGECLGF
jgi:hypothetical protein